MFSSAPIKVYSCQKCTTKLIEAVWEMHIKSLRCRGSFSHEERTAGLLKSNLQPKAVAAQMHLLGQFQWVVSLLRHVYTFRRCLCRLRGSSCGAVKTWLSHVLLSPPLTSSVNEAYLSCYDKQNLCSLTAFECKHIPGR